MSQNSQAEITYSEGTHRFLAAKDKQLLVNNEWVAAYNDTRLDSIDPATGHCLATIAEAGKDDVDRAVAAARAALKAPDWGGITGADRANLLWRVADLMEQHIDELAELETLDQGKPLGVGRWAEIPGAIAQFRYFAGQCTRLEGETIPPPSTISPPGSACLPILARNRLGSSPPSFRGTHRSSWPL